MKLREFFTADVVSLNLQSESKDDILKELVALLHLDPKSEGILFKTLKRLKPSCTVWNRPPTQRLRKGWMDL